MKKIFWFCLFSFPVLFVLLGGSFNNKAYAVDKNVLSPGFQSEEGFGAITGLDSMSASKPYIRMFPYSAAKMISVNTNYKFSYPFTDGYTCQLSHSVWGTCWAISWESNSPGNICLPRLLVEVDTGGRAGIHVVYWDLPMTYVMSAGVRTPVFPSYQTGNSCSFEYSAIDSMIAQIVRKDVSKKYCINWIIFSVIEYDSTFSEYYKSARDIVNGSLKLNDSPHPFTRIESESILFGTVKFYQWKKIGIRDDYRNILGYN
jgi:hypothetical protein